MGLAEEGFGSSLAQKEVGSSHQPDTRRPPSSNKETIGMDDTSPSPFGGGGLVWFHTTSPPPIGHPVTFPRGQRRMLTIDAGPGKMGWAD